MRPYVPLGILYVSAWLERSGIPNEVFDTTFSTKAALFSHLETSKPDYIGIYVNLMTRNRVVEIVRFLREQPSLAKTRIILGGPEVKYNADGFLERGVDFLVVGEGEQTMQELIETLDSSTEEEARKVTGIAYRDEDGKTVFTPERKKLRSIDELPVPNRSAIDLHRYLDTWRKHHGEGSLSVSTMRGCPYTCRWCSRAVYGLSYRRRSPEQVVDELTDLVKTYNPDSFWFVDDVFSVSHKWLASFTALVQERKLKFRYECITRADRMSEEVIELLRDSGCFRVWIGAESGSQNIIDRMDRRVDVNEVREMIKLTRKKGLQAGTFIMLGYPGETEEDIEETIHHLKTSNPDQFTITVAYPIKGTELFQEVEALDVTQIDFDTQNDRDRDFKRTYNRRYYDFAVRRVVNEVNYHKARHEDDQAAWKAMNFKLRSTAAKMGMWLERKRS